MPPKLLRGLLLGIIAFAPLHGSLPATQDPSAVRLLSKLEALESSAEHPLFALHWRSLRALIQAELARALAYGKESVMPARIHGDVLAIEQGLDAGNDRWEAYRDGGLPLTVAYISKRDRTLQLYYLVLPKAWDETKPYPLYVELHGSGGPETRPLDWAGKTLKQAPNYEKGHSQVATFAMHARDGFHVLPYGRGNSGYVDIGAITVDEAIADATTRIKTDPDRHYLYGFSMGGGGTYLIAASNPARWAAIAIMGGSPGLRDAPEANAVALSELPVYLWCGEDDQWISSARQKAALLQATGTRPRIIRFEPGVGHNYRGEAQRDAHTFMQQFSRRDAP